MNTYELLYIIGTQFTDTEVEGVRESVVTLIKNAGGEVARHENLGKIKLAYPIKGMRHGTYVVVHIAAESSAIEKIDRQLRLADDVLRHQLVTLPESAKDREYNISAYIAPLSEEGRALRREQKKEQQAAAAKAKKENEEENEEAPKSVAPPTPTKTEDTAPKLTMEELDKKLDKILEGDVTDNV